VEGGAAVNPRLQALLAAGVPGQPMGDELIDLLVVHLIAAAGGSAPPDPLDKAVSLLLAQTIRLVETLHEIRTP
jgi:hypothetical protein